MKISKRVRRVLAAVALVVSLVVTGAACDSRNDKRGKGDAPVAARSGDDSPAFCTNMPDEFSNVCAKCLYGFPGMAFTSTTHDGVAADVKVFSAPAGMCTGTKAVPVPVTPSPTGN